MHKPQTTIFNDEPPRRTEQAVRATILRSAVMTTLAGIGLAAILTLTACETTEGAGRDIEKLGDNIADSADKHKP